MAYAEGEERGVTEAQDPAISPDEIEGKSQHRIAQVLADEAERVRREMQRRGRGGQLIERRDDNRDAGEQDEEDRTAAVRVPRGPQSPADAHNSRQHDASVHRSS